ncbi:uncharacterized protein M421DRAFT_182801 [Didymella exigua CBS 183.55]|uniref:Uncharacterized protein n=1 Tax=Didymella exigua CBS 183.55 TaxID=1150837 RepID=A0A6A5RJJ1_9PLEO|nr:uncharacterized protein M421DRAFT_182801 [Didymella exigua CBS 183.55]KAF1927144.1 hypothetical protein M421DRAFT_182801 [Didymella exigua CBS 183.55]
MGKRHNRKRTRSRPRHRDSNSSNRDIQHIRSNSFDTIFSQSTVASYQPMSAPITDISADHWHSAYLAWQNRLRLEQERAKAVESHQLRFFGGEPGDEDSLFEPMMKVVTDLFDGYDDFRYP